MSAPRIYCCETLGTDVQAVLSGNRCGDAQCISFPGRCGRPAVTWAEVRDLCPAGPAILAGGECLARLGSPPDDLRRIHILRRAHCASLLCGDYAFASLSAAGAYLVTPGWLNNWRTFVAGWGFDRATGAEFFAESCARVTLLDSGSSPAAKEQLQMFGEFVKRPVEVAPVGLELFALQLEKALAASTARR